MMPKIFIIPVIIIASLCCVQSSCKKNNVDTGDELPPLTFTGANTIGCKINGMVWVPKGETSLSGITYPTSGGYYETAFFPGIHIRINTHSPDGHIELFCRNYSGVGYLLAGKYVLNKNTGDIRFGTGQIHHYAYYYTNGKGYFTDSLHNGWIEILKSDSINKIISGRFEFEGYNSSDGKIYRITEGRFDYRTH